MSGVAKCIRCRKRKAKRSCPAVGGGLCPLCCGSLRDREVHCPPHCPHREMHKPYQDRRLTERGPEQPGRRESPREDILRDERLAWLALNADAPLADIALRRPDFTDADAVLAMETAREKLDKGAGLLVLPGEGRKPRNEAAEAVRQSLDACRFERSVILSGGTEGYATEEKILVLDRLLLAARSFARENPAGRTYLDRIAAQFSQMRQDTDGPKIISPR